MRPHQLWIAGILAILCVPALTSSSQSPAATQLGKEKVIYAFKGTPDGSGPQSNLTLDRAGNLYGTTDGGGYLYGTVFELNWTADGWEEKLLYSFTGGNDGVEPNAGLIFDADGNLYGTTLYGGTADNGTAFAVDAGRQRQVDRKIVAQL